MMVSRPIHELRRGLIVVRVWRKRTKGCFSYTITAVRLFRNGDQWKESTRFGCDDIPLLRLVLNEAHTLIILHTGRTT